MTTQKLGNAAEQSAQTFLEGRGLSLIAKNFSCRLGEIDLIMQDKNCIVFVEVRLRNNPLYGSGAESITANKIRKISSTAQFFLQRHPIGNYDCRFDVISMDDKIDWIPNAFTLD